MPLSSTLPYQIAADAVLSLHVALVVFVVGGLALIIVGNVLSWRWVNVLWFRVLHLAAIAVIVAESWLAIVCPLTSLEMWLRTQARTPTYTGSFIEYWLQSILYYNAPPWVFITAYSLFALLVVATWLMFPPTRRRHAQ